MVRNGDLALVKPVLKLWLGLNMGLSIRSILLITDSRFIASHLISLTTWAVLTHAVKLEKTIKTVVSLFHKTRIFFP